ncbi:MULTISPECIES: hypothetical protein [unclassified Microcoleus]
MEPAVAKLSNTRKSWLRRPETLNTSTTQQSQMQSDITLQQL